MSITFRSLLEQEKRESILDVESELTIYKYIHSREFPSLVKEYREFCDNVDYITFNEWLLKVVVADRIYEESITTAPKYIRERNVYARSSESVNF
jgi:hypothetical protein